MERGNHFEFIADFLKKLSRRPRCSHLCSPMHGSPRKETRLAMIVTCYLFKNKCKWLKGNISELIQVIVSSYEKGK